MKGFAGDVADVGFLEAEFGGVWGKVVWDNGEVGIIAQDAPMKHITRVKHSLLLLRYLIMPVKLENSTLRL